MTTWKLLNYCRIYIISQKYLLFWKIITTFAMYKTLINNKTTRL